MVYVEKRLWFQHPHVSYRLPWIDLTIAHMHEAAQLFKCSGLQISSFTGRGHAPNLFSCIFSSILLLVQYSMLEVVPIPISSVSSSISPSYCQLS